MPTDKPHFEKQEGDTEYITESGKVRNGHDILNFKQRTPLNTCSVGEKSSVNPSHCHRDASMVLIHVLPLKFAGLVRQVQKRDYGRDIKKRADERRDTIYWFPPCDLIEKRIAIYVHL